ncbi:MAG: ABC-F family ATP-binding cassette domain-containing protein [Clostridiales bacterium]
MNILSTEKISKSFGEKTLFNEISFGINEGEKIGLIGINGTGKSTLLKIIANIESYDTGNIIKRNNLKIEYLPQNPIFEKETTVIGHIFRSASPIMELIRDYELVLNEIENNPNDINLGKKLLLLSQKMDTTGAWTIESEVKSILTKLGITDYHANICNLSGGERKRIAIAGALLLKSDLLILDEPTNHIDNNTINWLEEYLSNKKGSLLMVTHDRYFLDRVTNRIIELYNGKLYSYKANYTKYIEMKAEREEVEQSYEKKRINLFKKELEWIKKGAKARTTKQKARISRFEKLESEKSLLSDSKINISTAKSRLGKKLIEIKDISKNYSNKILFKNFSYNLLKDDRIGIIGPNGIGKSTLIKMIANKLKPDTGSIELGKTIKLGLFSQENEEMNESLRVIEYIKEIAEFIVTDDGETSASQMLDNFLFPPTVQWSIISKLSGGEKRRLFLLSILMKSPNVLILDEPTNDLDIHTLTILENYLENFPGAVITVSHDRYFLNKLANKIFAFEGNGFINKISGNYNDYYNLKSNNETNKKLDKQKNDKKNNFQKKKTILKFTFKEKIEFEEIDNIIENLEKELNIINNKIDLVLSDYEKLQSYLEEKEKVAKKLDSAIDRWTYLNELAEKIENQH